MRTPYGGDRYSDVFVLFLPFSRRFELRLDVPDLVSNGTVARDRGYLSEFGDLMVTPRFMLTETRSTTQVFAMPIRIPTGTAATGNGIMAVTPRYEFWTNPGGPWVARGSAGPFVALNQAESKSPTSFVGGLAVGRYFRPHDVPFGDLVAYADTNLTVPLSGGASRKTLATVGAGFRFHLGRNYFVLGNWEFPVTGPLPMDSTLTFALAKIF